MSNFLPLKERLIPESINKPPESQFWNSFVNPVIVNEFNSVSSIHFSPTSPYDFAVTASTRVQIYNCKTQAVTKSISRFTETAYSGSFRSDGKLIVAGDHTGLIQVFDINSRAILRTMKEHKGPVQLTKFHPDNTRLISGSDDKLVKIWDIPSQVSTQTFTGHTDYVRTGSVVPDDPNMFLSGSYDGLVKLWDARCPSHMACALTIDHEAAVEDVLVYPTGGLIAVAGGPRISIYDLLSGRKVHTLDNFQKTVTSITLDGEQQRLLAGSLDHHVKVYDLTEYTMQHSIKYPGSVLSVAISPDNTTLAVGMVSGALSIRQRVASPKPRVIEEKFFKRTPVFSDELSYLKKIKMLDGHLRHFEYAKAFDDLMYQCVKNPGRTFAGIRELSRLGALEIALSGRDDKFILGLINFLAESVNLAHYKALILEVVKIIMDIYEDVISGSLLLAKPIKNLQSAILNELELQKALLGLSGVAEMIKAKAASQ